MVAHDSTAARLFRALWAGDLREESAYLGLWPAAHGASGELLVSMLKHAAGLGPAPAWGEVTGALGRIGSLQAPLKDQLLRTALRAAVRDWRVEDGLAVVEAIAQHASDANVTNLGRAFAALLRGDTELDVAWFDRVVEAARASGDPVAMVDLSVVESLLALEAGQVEQGVQCARLALRWADAEELPQEQYFASLALARARRHRGTPHLAARIVGGLAKYAPPSWAQWLGWEAVLSGASGVAAAAEGRAAGLQGFAAALARGESPAPPAWPGLPAFVAADVATLRGVFGDGAVLDTRAEVRRWVDGETADVPRGMHIFASAVDTAEVVVTPDGRARRRLVVGRQDDPEARKAASARRPERTEHGICVLAFRGLAGMDETEFFREVYGFEFEARVHKSVYEMLLHRMRKHLGEAAAVERDDGRITLKAKGEVRVVDPRCMPTLAEQIAGEISRRGSPSARDLAEALKVPLRTVQEALSGLSEEGGCVSVRDGRNVVYKIEDTTFMEPTKFR